MGRDLETICEVPEAFHAADFRVDMTHQPAEFVRGRRGLSTSFLNQLSSACLVVSATKRYSDPPVNSFRRCLSRCSGIDGLVSKHGHQNKGEER